MLKLDKVNIPKSSKASQFPFSMNVIFWSVVENLDLGFVAGKLDLEGHNFVIFGVGSSHNEKLLSKKFGFSEDAIFKDLLLNFCEAQSISTLNQFHEAHFMLILERTFLKRACFNDGLEGWQVFNLFVLSSFRPWTLLDTREIV